MYRSFLFQNLLRVRSNRQKPTAQSFIQIPLFHSMKINWQPAQLLLAWCADHNIRGNNGENGF